MNKSEIRQKKKSMINEEIRMKEEALSRLKKEMDNLIYDLHQYGWKSVVPERPRNEK